MDDDGAHGVSLQVELLRPAEIAQRRDLYPCPAQVVLATYRPMRRVSWLNAALKAFHAFPRSVQEQVKFAIEIAAAGEMADVAKPLKGFDAGVYEIALAHRSDAFRVVYAVKLAEDVWIVHAFQKKSNRGIKTPRHEIDLIHARIKRLRELKP